MNEGGGDGDVRYSINLDVARMNAIVGSLHVSERGDDASFRGGGEPSSSDARERASARRGRGGHPLSSSSRPLRRKTTESLFAVDEGPSSSDAREGASARRSRGGHRLSSSLRPLRRKTTESLFAVDDDDDEGPTIVVEREESGPFRRGAGARDGSDDVGGPPAALSKKVSWSNLHSVSLFDLNKSPDAAAAAPRMNAAFPPPPLAFDGGSEAAAPDAPRRRSQHRKKQTSPKSPRKTRPIRVISLPWTHRGVVGEYTGEVNSSIEPHGKGSFHSAADDDDDDDPAVTFYSATWKDGRLVSAEVSDHSLNYSLGSSLRSGGSAGSGMTRRTQRPPDPPPSAMRPSGSPSRGGGSCSSSRGGSSTSKERMREAERMQEAERANASSHQSTFSPRTHLPDAASSSNFDGYNGRASHPAASPSSDSNGEDGTEYSPASLDQSARTVVSTTSLPGYRLGHPARRRSHMVVLPPGSDPEIAIENAGGLKPLDFAFVLRSDKTWTYSIVADRPFSEDGPSIRFVLDAHGSTKTIRKKNWIKGIRLVNPVAVLNEQSERDIAESLRQKSATHSTPRSKSTSSGSTGAARAAPAGGGSIGERDGGDGRREGRARPVNGAKFSPPGDGEHGVDALDGKLRAVMSFDYLGAPEGSDEERQRGHRERGGGKSEPYEDSSSRGRRNSRPDERGIACERSPSYDELDIGRSRPSSRASFCRPEREGSSTKEISSRRGIAGRGAAEDEVPRDAAPGNAKAERSGGRGASKFGYF